MRICPILIVVLILVIPIGGCVAEESSQIKPPKPESVTVDADADVIFVKAIEQANNTWTFQVTVQHPDQGWEDYADGWDVVMPDGSVIKPDQAMKFTRLLLHPHVNEQPFTRSQSGIVIPPGVTELRVRAHDIVNGYGGQEIIVDLEITNGDGYEVERLN